MKSDIALIVLAIAGAILATAVFVQANKINKLEDGVQLIGRTVLELHQPAE